MPIVIDIPLSKYQPININIPPSEKAIVVIGELFLRFMVSPFEFTDL